MKNSVDSISRQSVARCLAMLANEVSLNRALRLKKGG
jgi:hypothetical protein